MTLKHIRVSESLAVLFSLLLIALQPVAQEKRTQQGNKVTQIAPLTSSAFQKRSDDNRVRAFRRRHRDVRAESDAQITVAQAQQILQTKNYYASLSPRKTFVDGKGYLNFIFTGSADPAEVSGKNGTADLPNSLQVVEIGLKASSPVKTYLVDCMVKGPGPCYECSFNMIGPDGQSETWQMPNSDWRHLLFTITPGDTEWYPLKLTARLSMTFKSCDVTEVP